MYVRNTEELENSKKEMDKKNTMLLKEWEWK